MFGARDIVLTWPAMFGGQMRAGLTSPFGGFLAKGSVISLLILLLLAPAAIAFPTGISGSSVDTGCMCHGDATVDESVEIQIIGLPEVWEIGVSYELTLQVSSTVTENGEATAGFNLRATAGELAAVDTSVQMIDGELTHTEEGNSQRSWDFIWTAPSKASPRVGFNAFVNTVDGDGEADSDDRWNAFEVQANGPAKVWTGTDSPPVWKSVILGLFLAAIVVNILPHGGGAAEIRRERSQNSEGEE